jgi:type IV pilus assembly protein PilY1
MSGPITVDYGLNYNTDLAYYGLSRETAHGWEGSIYRVYVPKTSGDWRDPSSDDVYNTDPASWVIAPMVEVDGPITASAAASFDTRSNIWVYFGTGRYFNDPDKVDDTTQYFYGIKDPVYNREMYLEQDDAFGKQPHQFDIVDTTGIDVYTDRTVEGLGGINEWYQLVNYVQSADGWVFELGQEAENDGERVLNKPTILGGIVYDTSFVPNQDICGFSGNSNLLAFYYETGTSYYREAFSGGSEEEDVGGGETKTKLSRKTSVGVGRASGVSVHVGKGSHDSDNPGGVTGYVQQSTGIVVDTTLTPPMNVRSGLVYWRER